MPNNDDDTKLWDEMIALHKRSGMSEKDAELQAKVDLALDTAASENGYEEIATWGSMLVALDLVKHKETFKEYRPTELRPFVGSWQKRHGGDRAKIEWATGPDTRKVVYIPKMALELAEVQIITNLTTYAEKAAARANENALQTLTLGRHLSICRKALAAVRAVMVEVTKLRIFGGDPKTTGNPLDVYAAGYLAMQDASALTAAVEAAAELLRQLEKEYPELNDG